MYFVDNAKFRQTIREYSIEHDRDVFTINDKFKFQAKCKN